MLASAILVVGTRALMNTTFGESLSGDGAEAPTDPIASLEILGQSIVEHTLRRLRSAGINSVSVVSEAALSTTAGRRFVPDVLMKQARKGFKKVLLIGLGAYTEVDFPELLQFHEDSGASVTRVCDADGPLDFWVLDTAPPVLNGFDSSSDADMPSDYLTRGYVNRLTGPRDLRRLAVDAFLGHCAIRPRGREIRPGIWLDAGARVHRSARIVAPAYIGRGARVRASALITRFSNVERRCLVDCGTVIEDSSLLPHTYVGKALDVVHSVVEGHRLANLSCDVAIAIEDSNIIGRTPAPRRWFGYGDKKAKAVAPLVQIGELEPVPSVTTLKWLAPLRMLSKREV